MAERLAGLFKSCTLSDCRVQIRVVGDQAQPDVANVVPHDLPGHRVVFFGASEYFQVLLAGNWEQFDGTIHLDVLRGQEGAAEELVHYIYCGCFKTQDLSQHDKAQLLVLADRYQISACVKDCVDGMLASLRASKQPEAVLQVCGALSTLGTITPTTEKLFAHLTEEAARTRSVLSTLASDQLAAEVEVLRSMFQDMDRVWAQPEFRQILHLFPWQALHGLVSWDGMRCASENVVATAITHWIAAQPQPVEAAAVNQLLHAVRVPYLSPGYLTQVFPALPWVAGSEEGPGLARLGATAALAGEDYFRVLYGRDTWPHWRTLLPDMVHRRDYQPAEVTQEWEWTISLQEICAALARARQNEVADARRTGRKCFSSDVAGLRCTAASWVNGVLVTSSAMAHQQPGRQPYVRCDWEWDARQ